MLWCARCWIPCPALGEGRPSAVCIATAQNVGPDRRKARARHLPMPNDCRGPRREWGVKQRDLLPSASSERAMHL